MFLKLNIILKNVTAVGISKVLITWWVGRSGERSAGVPQREPSLLPRKQERSSQDVRLLWRLGEHCSAQQAWKQSERSNEK